MKTVAVSLIVVLLCSAAFGQEVDHNLLKMKQELDAVNEAKAQAELTLDIDFINMPTKYADIHYVKGQPIEYFSDNFIIIPKRGLDFTWNELFQYSFMTVDRGTEEMDGREIKVLNIIPLDKKADFAIMTMKLDTVSRRVLASEITTKNNGTFLLYFKYEGENFFPSELKVEFEIEKIKIPLNFMGKDTEIDKMELKADGPKRGKIYLTLDWYKMNIDE